jgi:hypothetical protein
VSQNGNGNGKLPQVSISTLVKTRFNGGDLYQTISQLMDKKPTGLLSLKLSQGGILYAEWTEESRPQK